MLITLEEAKKHIHVSYDDDDEGITSYIIAAEAYIDYNCGTAYKEKEEFLPLAGLLEKKLVSDMYDNRSTGISEKTKRSVIVTTIMDALSLAGDE